MRVFVTGGSGFVGGHVIEMLSADHEVFAMARSESSARVVEGFGARAVRSSLDDITPEHLAGIDAVVHAAAYVLEWGTERDYFDANVGGTKRMLEAARAAGVKRFVLVSTNATVHDGKGQRDVDETAPYTEVPHFHYGASKAAAERLVLDANSADFVTTAIRPSFVWGPRDTTVLPAVKRMVDEGTYVWLDHGAAVVSTTHVYNLVHAVRLALTEGSGGEAYFVADSDDIPVRGFIQALGEGAGFTLPDRSVPSWIVRGLAGVFETIWGALGLTSTPPVTRTAALVMSADMTVSTEKIRRDLGWTPVIERSEGVAALAA